jgi:hypothetical protein
MNKEEVELRKTKSCPKVRKRHKKERMKSVGWLHRSWAKWNNNLLQN